MFRFDGIKNITCGEGGCVVTSDIDVINRVKDSRLLGVEKDSQNRYKGIEVGILMYMVKDGDII